MAFKDYTELVPPLRLPYQGHEYELPYIAAEDVQTVRAALDPTAEQPDDAEVERILLGDSAAAMRADKVPPGFIQRAILTALADFGSGRRYAEVIWETAGEPGALEAWLTEHTSTTVEPTA